MKFEELGLGPKLLQALEESGYSEPTPIQEKAIPAILMTRDIIGLAQTGTGKTAGFILPMIEILASGRAKARMPRSLVLAPTRELAAQVAENFKKYGKYHKLAMALLVGGESVVEQKKIIEKGVDVLIATPGRLLDLFERGELLLNDMKVIVIDEADRMLDMGFIPDIEKIFSILPTLRQTLLFSATMPPEIEKLASKFLRNPKNISVAPPASPAKTVEQFLVWCQPRTKQQTLMKIIRQENVKNAFIFCNRKREADSLARSLQKKGESAAALHGDMPQSKRYETLQKFKDKEIRLLICSDVAARGLDVEAMSHVFNYDVPFNADDYVHRIGRTGRAGMKGRAWTLATKEDEKNLRAIEKLIQKKIQDATDEVAGGETESGSRGPRQDNRKPSDREGRPEKSDKRPSRDDRRPGKNKRSHGEREESEDNNDVVGFGNDIPAFFR